MKRLKRYPLDGMIGGVCEGIGRLLEIDPLIFRLAWVALLLLCGVGIIPYIVLWIIVPEADDDEDEEEEDEHEDL